jgi:hypothetical protein
MSRIFRKKVAAVLMALVMSLSATVILSAGAFNGTVVGGGVCEVQCSHPEWDRFEHYWTAIVRRFGCFYDTTCMVTISEDFLDVFCNPCGRQLSSTFLGRRESHTKC